MGNDKNACHIVVKFSKYKDRTKILKKAKECLSRDSGYSVPENFSDRVKFKRRMLQKLVEATENGQQATISFDKLVVDNNIFVYDDYLRTIIQVGVSKSRRLNIENRGASHVISNQS